MPDGKHEGREWYLSTSFRRYLYCVACALTALLFAYGILTNDLMAAWNFLFSTLFAVAAVNSSEKGEHRA
nr:MAG TPA: Mycobacterial 2 TMS Phage Holin (M2 Hol) Family [Caudoviricetes sp.]